MLAKSYYQLLLIWLGIIAASAHANTSEKAVTKLQPDEIPSEEFWNFMAEFSDEGELVDPEDLAGVGTNKDLKLVTLDNKSSEQAVSSTGNSEESL